eukprot:scaffold7591_cov229-Pinguiococcus_pyrenoidosus.AAC.1
MFALSETAVLEVLDFPTRRVLVRSLALVGLLHDGTGRRLRRGLGWPSNCLRCRRGAWVLGFRERRLVEADSDSALVEVRLHRRRVDVAREAEGARVGVAGGEEAALPLVLVLSLRSKGEHP